VLTGEGATPAILQWIRHEYMLDRPLYVQYGHWVWLALHGNLGRGIQHLSVAKTILNRLPTTLELATLSLLLAILIGVPAGVIAATRRGKVSDHAARSVALVGQSVPHFWLGLLLIIWFAVDLHWLPATGYSSISHPIANLRHLVLPVVMLGFGAAALLRVSSDPLSRCTARKRCGRRTR
jgi:peptide/nickel transport system permease protein